MLCWQPKNQPESDRFLGPSYLLPIYPHKLHIKSTRKRSLSWLFLSTPHIHAINTDTGSCPRQVIPTWFVSRVQITLNMTRYPSAGTVSSLISSRHGRRHETRGPCFVFKLISTRHGSCPGFLGTTRESRHDYTARLQPCWHLRGMSAIAVCLPKRCVRPSCGVSALVACPP